MILKYIYLIIRLGIRIELGDIELSHEVPLHPRELDAVERLFRWIKDVVHKGREDDRAFKLSSQDIKQLSMLALEVVSASIFCISDRTACNFTYIAELCFVLASFDSQGVHVLPPNSLTHNLMALKYFMRTVVLENVRLITENCPRADFRRCVDEIKSKEMNNISVLSEVVYNSSGARVRQELGFLEYV
jgi:hypothetical protein